MISDDQARAVEAVAKAWGISVEAVRAAGSFLAHLSKSPLTQMFGLIGDKLAYRRYEEYLAFSEKTQRYMEERSLTFDNSKAVPLKIAIPVLESASIEDNDDIKDIWARLITNAMDPSVTFNIKHAYVSVLKDIDILEAKILNELCKNRFKARAYGVYTKDIPNSYLYSRPTGNMGENKPSRDVELALSNLVRLRCLTPAQMAGGGDSVAHVHLTSFGEALVEACSTPGTEDEAEPQS